VKINPELNLSDREKLWDLVREYSDIFSDVPTPTNLVTYDIKLKSDEPIRHKPYKIPVHLVDKVEEELQKMVRLGWIERNENPEYSSPMVIVKKRDSPDLRICVSFKALNANTVIDPTPQPDMEDILAKLGKSKIYSTFDACKGFYAIKMEESAKKYTSFVTPRDCYRFNVCPFGLVNAPSVYAKLTRKLLQQLNNVDNFVDDLIAYNNDVDHHVSTLKELFERVRRANLKLKPSKVKIGFTEITFLGQIVGNGSVRPTQESIDKILTAPIPRTKKGVRSLCGMINWLRKFLPSAARLLKPLTDLTSKHHGDVINWGPEQQKVWDEIKQILTTKPVLTLYDASKDHVLMTDASDYFIGGCLMQREDDGELHPVMYASRKCLDRECRYDIQNKEMLAIVWCCSRFYRFIYGAPFVIQTDCCALSMLNGKLSNNARVVRWQLYLQSFNFRVEVVRGQDNCLADFMTRMGT
jgi:putative transposase